MGNAPATVFQQRRSGVLLHITSLPAGNLGQDAYQFVDFLAASGMTVWQVLPLGPTQSDGSPYQCLSAHAGSAALICPHQVGQATWANDESLGRQTIGDLATLAYQQFQAAATAVEQAEFDDFCHSQAHWLQDYALFCVLRQASNTQPWWRWATPVQQRDAATLTQLKQDHAVAISIRQFEQFLFFKQWQQLRAYANEHGVLLFGDIPIFVGHDSADVWANPDLFELDDAGMPTKVAGVPPDYFSETGQRWGNPLYRWQAHESSNFAWWQARVQTQLDLFDIVRIDHFRGFDACWEIPAECETAIGGEWVPAPGNAMFAHFDKVWGALPLVAEDLGIITDEVTALRERYALPGMKILHFAFGDDDTNPYLPPQHTVDSVVYTGTHDNDTTVGWYAELDDDAREKVADYCNQAGIDSTDMPWALMALAFSSTAQMAIVPMQDILSLDSTHRMNIPGTCEGNWQWKFSWEMLEANAATRLKTLNQKYQRI